MHRFLEYTHMVFFYTLGFQTHSINTFSRIFFCPCDAYRGRIGGATRGEALGNHKPFRGGAEYGVW